MAFTTKEMQRAWWAKQTPEKKAEYKRRYRAKQEAQAVEQQSALRYREANRDMIAAKKHKYRQRPEVKEAALAYDRQWRKKNKAKVKALKKKWSENNPWYEASRNPKRLVQWHANHEAIAGSSKPDKCEVCGGDDGGIVFDHCHQRGHFRGWICRCCNLALGYVKDDPQRLMMLAAYLKRTIASTSLQLTLPGV